MDKTFDLYRDIAERTDGDVYIGVVGPVRTGKSTLIARMMEKLVLPAMAPGPRRDRLSDELPQSGSGRTIMTTQPKFVPGEAVTVTLGDQATVRVRMVDSVGYLVEGALGTEEDGAARMVHTPWFDYDIPFEQAAETGTRKVIADHATIGLVVTTDGTVADLPRESYTAAEERVVSELKTLGKPFIVVLNSRTPDAPDAQRLRERLAGRYGVPVMAMNVKEMEVDDILGMFEQVLFQFPLREIRIAVPDWLSALDEGHWLAAHVLEGVRAGAAQVTRVGDYAAFAGAFADSPYTEGLKNEGIDLGQGRVRFSLPLKDGLFNRVLGEECGTEIRGDAHLLRLMKELVAAKTEYDHVADALKSVRETGYGLVTPTMNELTLQEPEIVKQGSRFGVRLKANAPSLHLIRVDIETEVSPVVGTEKQSEELVRYLLEEFENDPQRIWNTDFFGKSLHELVREGLSNKLMRMPADAQEKVQETLSKIINEGNGGDDLHTAMSAAEKLGWRQSFPPGFAPAAYFAGGFAAGSPGGGRRKVALLAQGHRIHRAGRWIRISAWRAAALQTSEGWCGKGGSGVASGAVRRGAFLVSFGHSKRWRGAGRGGPHPWRERWARGRVYRGVSGRMQRGF